MKKWIKRVKQLLEDGSIGDLCLINKSATDVIFELIAEIEKLEKIKEKVEWLIESIEDDYCPKSPLKALKQVLAESEGRTLGESERKL